MRLRSSLLLTSTEMGFHNFPSHLYGTSVIPRSFFGHAHTLSFHVFCAAPPPPLCPASLFFLRALGGAPCGPVAEVFLHRPQPGPPPLSGRGPGPPPPAVLLPPPPLPKLAHLRPGPPRVPPRSAPLAPPLHTPSLTPRSATGLVGTVLVLWFTHALLLGVSACLPVSVVLQIASWSVVSCSCFLFL